MGFGASGRALDRLERKYVREKFSLYLEFQPGKGFSPPCEVEHFSTPPSSLCIFVSYVTVRDRKQSRKDGVYRELRRKFPFDSFFA